jgi:hypothetical protein
VIVHDHQVGGEVDSICGKCKEEKRHVIHAIVDGKPKRCECLSCHAVHNYRPVASAKAAKRAAASGRPRKPKRDAGTSEPLDATVARAYDPKKTFESGMVLKHEHFGLGKIVAVGTKVMTVAFRDQTRKLFLTP